jgi:hypothetical protein
MVRVMQIAGAGPAAAAPGEGTIIEGPSRKQGPGTDYEKTNKPFEMPQASPDLPA